MATNFTKQSTMDDAEYRKNVWKWLLLVWVLLAVALITVGLLYGFRPMLWGQLSLALGAACLAMGSIRHIDSKTVHRVWLGLAVLGLALSFVFILIEGAR